MDWLYVFNVSIHVVLYGIATIECNKFLVALDDPNDKDDWIINWPEEMRMDMYKRISLAWPIVFLVVILAFIVGVILKHTR